MREVPIAQKTREESSTSVAETSAGVQRLFFYGFKSYREISGSYLKRVLRFIFYPLWEVGGSPPPLPALQGESTLDITAAIVCLGLFAFVGWAVWLLYKVWRKGEKG